MASAIGVKTPNHGMYVPGRNRYDPGDHILTKVVGEQFNISIDVVNNGDADGFAGFEIGVVGVGGEIDNVIGGVDNISVPQGATVNIDISGPTSSNWPVDQGAFSAQARVLAGDEFGGDRTNVFAHTFNLTVNSSDQASNINVVSNSLVLS